MAMPTRVQVFSRKMSGAYHGHHPAANKTKQGTPQ